MDYLSGKQFNLWIHVLIRNRRRIYFIYKIRLDGMDTTNALIIIFISVAKTNWFHSSLAFTAFRVHGNNLKCNLPHDINKRLRTLWTAYFFSSASSSSSSPPMPRININKAVKINFKTKVFSAFWCFRIYSCAFHGFCFIALINAMLPLTC